MSIVRIGLAETKHFAQGYDAIFGKKKGSRGQKVESSSKKSATKKTGKSKKRNG